MLQVYHGYLYRVRETLFRLYLEVFSSFLALFFFLFGWKAPIIRTNLIRTGFHDSLAFRWKLFRHMAQDLLRFLGGFYGQSLSLRPSDALKYKDLQTQGGLLLVGHFHNWELLGSWLRKGGMPLIACAKPLANRHANTLLNLARKRIQLPTLTRDWPRGVMKALRAGKVVAFLWDQRPEKGDSGLFSQFLGQSVEMNRLPAFLTEKEVLTVYFGVLLPGGEVRLVALGHGPLEKSRLARRYNRILEILVSRHPDYWYGWAHRRFAPTQHNP